MSGLILPTNSWNLTPALRMLYSPISLFNSNETFKLEVLPSEIEFDNFYSVSEELELLTLPSLLYPDTVQDNENAPLKVLLTDPVLTFDTFFATQLIDVPKCFKKSVSLYRSQSFDLDSRLFNNISRHGRKMYVTRLYSTIVQTLTNQFSHSSEQNTTDSTYLSWRVLYKALTPIFYTLHRNTLNLAALPDFEYVDGAAETWDRESYSVSTSDLTTISIPQTLKQYNPVFSFYIRRVDKLKRKHSRGKSGKYSISWKYVPEYKRQWIAIRWLTKDIKFQRSRTLYLKMLASFENLLFNQQAHLVYQLRNFVHRFVFQNYRKTLLKSLRSTS